MEELTIQTHSFEESKNQLKKFSEQTTTDLDLKRVSTNKDLGEWVGEYFKGGGIGKSHKVTGEELNGVTKQVQNHLIEINEMQRSFIQEFGQVYNALEALDKDYIQAILIAIKSSQKANAEARVAQNDIEKTIKIQKKTIKVLEQFKEKLDQNDHLKDVDQMWNDINESRNRLNRNDEIIDEIITSLSKQLKQSELHHQIYENIKDQEHISNIDEMWDKINKSQNRFKRNDEILDEISTRLNKQMEQLKSHHQIYENIKDQEHISNVDEMWGEINKSQSRLKRNDEIFDEIFTKLSEQLQLLDLHRQIYEKLNGQEHLSNVDEMHDGMDNLSNEISSLTETVSKQENLMIDLQNNLDNALKRSVEIESTLSGKLTRAYFMVGGSVLLGLLNILFW